MSFCGKSCQGTGICRNLGELKGKTHRAVLFFSWGLAPSNQCACLPARLLLYKPALGYTPRNLSEINEWHRTILQRPNSFASKHVSYTVIQLAVSNTREPIVQKHNFKEDRMHPGCPARKHCCLAGSWLWSHAPPYSTLRSMYSMIMKPLVKKRHTAYMLQEEAQLITNMLL